MDNVVKMPDLLARLADRAIRAIQAYEIGIVKHGAGRSEVIAAIIEYGKALREGRVEHKSDTRFGQWVVANKLDRVKPFDQQEERRAAMKIAVLSAQGAGTLGSCPATIPTNIMKWVRAQNKPKQSPKPRVNRIEEIAKAFKAETGNWPRSETLAKAAGVNSRSADNALRTLKAVEEATTEAVKVAVEAETAKTVVFSKAQQHHVDAAIKRRIKEIEKEMKARIALFDQKVQDESQKRFVAARDEVFPKLRERENAAVRAEETYRKMIDAKAIFTEAEFGNIRFCLHPDNSASEEKRQLAFTTFNLKKLVLTGKT